MAFAFIEAGAGTEMVTGSVHHGACRPSSALQWPRLCAAAYDCSFKGSKQILYRQRSTGSVQSLLKSAAT